MPKTGRLKQQTLLVSHFWRLEVLDQGQVSVAGEDSLLGLQTQHFLGVDVETERETEREQQERVQSLVPFDKDTNPMRSGPHSWNLI